MQWIDIHKRLPEDYVRVLTLLFTNDNTQKTIVNSVQRKNYLNAAGKLILLRVWAEYNLQVTHWLEGVPEFPEVPKKEE